MTREELRKYEPLWDKWYVQEHLGGGSYGDVYRITCQVYEHTYEAALKVISIPKNQSELQELELSCERREDTISYYDQLRQSITSEIDIMEQLKGRTNIVCYEDHDIIPHNQGMDPGYDIFIRMELLEDIRSVVGKESKQWKDNRLIQKLGLDIAKGLQICHGHNIIHRDIKLSNIFRSADGDFKIGDFGIARNVVDHQLTMSVKGTFNFMAPEVYNREHYDYRVDIYSLGMVLYYLLNKNREPFLPLNQVPTADEKEQALIRRMQGEVLPPPAFAGPRLAEVVLKACAFRQEDRYQSIEDFYQALLQLKPEDLERPDDERDIPEGKVVAKNGEKNLIFIFSVIVLAVVLGMTVLLLLAKKVVHGNSNDPDVVATEMKLTTPFCVDEITVKGNSEDEDGLIFENDRFDTIRIEGSFQRSVTDSTPVEGELALEYSGDVIEQSGNFTWKFTPTDTEQYLPVEGEIFITAIHRECVDREELENRINNMKDSRELASIYWLDLKGASFQNEDILVLASMPNLTILDLSDNQLTDISVLSKLKRLQEVYLNGNSELKDVSPLYELKNLTVVNLKGTKVSDKAKKKITSILGTDTGVDNSTDDSSGNNTKNSTSNKSSNSSRNNSKNSGKNSTKDAADAGTKNGTTNSTESSTENNMDDSTEIDLSDDTDNATDDATDDAANNSTMNDTDAGTGGADNSADDSMNENDGNYTDEGVSQQYDFQ